MNISTDYKYLSKHAVWLHRKRVFMEDAQKKWFRGNQSLTQQLLDHSQHNFSLELLAEYRAKPCMHEAKVLGIGLHRNCRIREVLLKCHGEATVYARSIISDQAIKASKHQLTKLGTTPLGHLLFKRAKVNLETRQVAKISKEDSTMYARRTLYQLNGENILVSEFFLQEVWQQ